MMLVLAIGLPVGGWCARAADPAPEPRLPELIRTAHRVFSIPFRLAQAREADAAPRRVVLSVSTDLGLTWQAAGEVAPSAGSFTYRGEMDGEYWFRIRTIDAQGRTRGGAGPDMRVLVDAAGPRVAARVWKGDDGEIICRYAATDDSLRMDSLRVEYRGPTDSDWKPLAAEGILSREKPAHMVGEDVWWAGEKVDSLAVRIAIADGSGNRTVKQFTLERSDPGVDQAALARELGVPPLPTGASPVMASAGGPDDTVATSSTARLSGTAASESGWAPERAAAWTADRPGAISPADGRGTSVGGVSRFVSRDPSASVPSPAVASSPEGSGMHYRGKPLQLSRSRRFAWEYEMPHGAGDGRPLRVELWYTRDSGITWQRAGVDTDGRSPIDVSLPAAGLYGFRLLIVPDASNNENGPRTGESPETWVAIDDEPPQVEITEVTPSTGDPGDGVLIRYACRDQLPSPRGVRLSFSPGADGPWSTIADGIEPEGTHRWQPDRTTPGSVYIRIEATDAAGNVGRSVSPEPVAIAAAQVVGRLRGLRELPSEAATLSAPDGAP
jgi:hypothetical protein